MLVRSLEEVETVSRNSRFFIDDKEVVLAENGRIITIFTAVRMVLRKLWSVKEISQRRTAWISFASVRCIVTDFKNFSIVVKYEFMRGKRTEDFQQRTPDAATRSNMTNHSYFNLNVWEGSGDVLDQELRIPSAKYFTPVKDSQSIPTGRRCTGGAEH